MFAGCLSDVARYYLGAKQDPSPKLKDEEGSGVPKHFTHVARDVNRGRVTVGQGFRVLDVYLESKKLILFSHSSPVSDFFGSK